MTAIADYASYKSLLLSPRFGWDAATMQSITNVAVGKNWGSWWTAAPPTGVAPSSAAACSRTTTGAMIPTLLDSAQMFISELYVSGGCNGPVTILFYDRLSHQGGLDGTVITAQTTNLPTAALTRYTSGVGVMAMVEVYTTLGTTKQTFTVSYTNEAGTAGRTSDAGQIANSGDTATRFAGATAIVSLQSGDAGVRSVQSLTLSASTGLAGNFGVTLIKPLVMVRSTDKASDGTIGSVQSRWSSLLGGGGNLPEVLSGACLGMLVKAPQTLLAGSTLSVTPKIIRP